MEPPIELKVLQRSCRKVAEVAAVVLDHHVLPPLIGNHSRVDKPDTSQRFREVVLHQSDEVKCEHLLDPDLWINVFTCPRLIISGDLFRIDSLFWCNVSRIILVPILPN